MLFIVKNDEILLEKTMRTVIDVSITIPTAVDKEYPMC